MGIAVFSWPPVKKPNSKAGFFPFDHFPPLLNLTVSPFYTLIFLFIFLGILSKQPKYEVSNIFSNIIFLPICRSFLFVVKNIISIESNYWKTIPHIVFVCVLYLY